MTELSMASKFLACRLCHAASECNNCCKQCAGTCLNEQRCYYELSEKELVRRAHINIISEGITMEVDKEILRWLTDVPEGDVNFKINLERANEPTIRAALEAIAANPEGKKTRETALLRQLKKILRETADHVKETSTRQHRALALNMGELEAERERQAQVSAGQTERELLIAQSYELAGQIKAVKMISKFGDVTSLMWLKQVKESKIYRDLPGIGTWDKYCEYVGVDRHTTDQNLLNLNVFGEAFIGVVSNLRVGYRELRQLRQLKYDGDSFSMSDDGKTVIIEGETIALGDDAAPEIEAALEKLLIKNKTLRERNGKLEKDLRGAVKEETAGLHSEISTYKARVKDLEKYEPKNMDETRFQAQFDEIHGHMSRLAASIRTVMAMENLQDNPGVMARVDGYVEGCNYLVDELRGLWADQCMFENK